MRDSETPFYAQVNFYIDIFPVGEDGSLLPNKLTQTELKDSGISYLGTFGVHGFNLEDCINKLNESLSKIKYDEE